MWENIVERDTTDDNIMWHVRIACWMNKATDTLRICNTYCFSMATVVLWTPLSVIHVCLLPVVLNSM